VHGDIHPATDPNPDNQPHRAYVTDANTESTNPPQLPIAHAESLHVPDIPDAHAESLHPAELPVANLDQISYAELLRHPKSLRHPEFFYHCDDRHPDGLRSTAAPRRPSRWADADDLPGCDH
jgi:hypothetical protein